MEIDILKEESITIVKIKGRVDTVTAPELENQVSSLFTELKNTLIFDCAEMSYISSSGLRIVLITHKQVTGMGKKFIVRNLTPEVLTVFELTGFSRILTIE